MKFVNNKKGFALLYSILLTGAILSVGVILMNIITKQLVYSSLNRNSETAYYYAANSGRECLADAILHGDFVVDSEAVPLVFKSSVNLKCFNLPSGDITLTHDHVAGVFKLNTGTTVELGGNKIDLIVYANETCLNASGPISGCDPADPDLKDKNTYVAISSGYSGAVGGDRTSMRNVVFVRP